MASELRTTGENGQAASGSGGRDVNAARVFPLRRPALLVAVTFVVGIVAAPHMGFGALPVAVTAAVLTACVIALRRFPHVALTCLVGAAFFAGSARMAQFEAHAIPEPQLAPLLDHPVTVTGRVATDPERDGERLRFGVRADSVRDGVYVLSGPARILVHADTSLGVPRYGESVQIRGMLRRPRSSAPGLFDYTAHLERAGYAAVLGVYRDGAVTMLPDPRTPGSDMLTRIRGYVRQSVTGHLDPVAEKLMHALILGERAEVPRESRDAFQSSGVIHVLAVSGLHVGIVIMGIGWPLRRALGLAGAFTAQRWLPLPLIGAAWAYAAITGMNPPVVRASIMATVFLLAMPVRRPYDSWNALAISALITLALNPANVFGASFQLSYAAMTGILFMSAALGQWSARSPFQSRAVRTVAAIIAVTIGAELLTWPVTAYHFGRVSFIGVLMSPVVVLLVSVAVWGGMLSVALGWVPGAAALIAPVVGTALGTAVWLTETAASFSFAAAWVRAPAWYEIALYLFALGTAYLTGMRRRWLKGVAIGALLLGNLFVWTNLPQRNPATEIVFLDVGQGDAIYCEFRNGRTLLIDGGRHMRGADAGERVVAPFLQRRGVTRLDAVIATHADNDHIGGLITVLDRLDVGMLLYNGVSDTGRTFTALMETAHRRGVPVYRVLAGDSLVGFGASVVFFGPPRDTTLYCLYDGNDLSVITRIDARGHSVLLTGDATTPIEARIVRIYGGRLQSDVLKLGHHGSATSTSEALLDAVRPSYGVVSAGRNNQYGHPAREVVERVRARGIELLGTYSLGTLIWRIEADTAYWRTGPIPAPQAAPPR